MKMHDESIPNVPLSFGPSFQCPVLLKGGRPNGSHIFDNTSKSLWEGNRLPTSGQLSSRMRVGEILCPVEHDRAPRIGSAILTGSFRLRANDSCEAVS